MDLCPCLGVCGFWMRGSWLSHQLNFLGPIFSSVPPRVFVFTASPSAALLPSSGVWEVPLQRMLLLCRHCLLENNLSTAPRTLWAMVEACNISPGLSS